MFYKPDYERLQYQLHPIAYSLFKLTFFTAKWSLVALIFVTIFKCFGVVA